MTHHRSCLASGLASLAALITILFLALDARSDTICVRVIDGDTIVIREDGGPEVHCRLIGINAPEVAGHGAPPGFYGQESSAFLRGLVEGRQVVTKPDEQTGILLDKYKRLLIYVYTVPDSKEVNLELVKGGYAKVYTDFKFSKMKSYQAAEKEAKAKGLGMWGTDSSKLRVWLTQHGSRYHKPDCPYLRFSHKNVSILLTEAALRFEPCSVCKPPTLPGVRRLPSYSPEPALGLR